MHLTSHQRQALHLLKSGTYLQAARVMGFANKSSISSLLHRAANMNGYASITDLRRAVQHIDLSKPPAIKRQRKKNLGVYLIARTGKYKAVISVRGRDVHLGCFGSPEAATAARMEAEQKYRGTIT